MSLRIAFRGNHSVDFSTESHVAASLESLGHDVFRIQENTVDWPTTVRICERADLFLWTSTFGYAQEWPQEDAWAAVEKLNAMLPTVALHLDLFFGLERADQVQTEPWFRLRHVATADGGHQDEFLAAGVNHIWSPPAVFDEECEPGTFDRRYASDIAFVGNWRGGYHAESTHRHELIRHLRRNWRGKVAFWPQSGAIRGQELRNLYASAKIVVGDSCLVPHLTHYCSDRVFEVTGRGGFLVHPHIDGIFPDLMEDGRHLVTWDAGDWDRLDFLIAHYLTHEDERREIARRGMEHVRANHTYRNRLEAVLAHVFAEVPA